VRNCPTTALLVQPDGETKAVVGILLELLFGPATEQRVRESNIVPGSDIKRDDLERGTLYLPLEEWAATYRDRPPCLARRTSRCRRF
jgi:hypothetical protein